MDDTQRTGWQKRILLFLTSQCITLFGSTLVQMALVWYATMQTSSGVWVAAFTVCSYLPQFLISFIGGVWADRYHRKKLIIGADLLIAFVTFVMVLAIPHISSEPALLGGLLVMSVIRSLGAGIQTPAVNAVIPQLVPEDQLMRYNGINATCRELEQEFGLRNSADTERRNPKAELKKVDALQGDIRHQIGNTLKAVLESYRFQTFGEYSALLSTLNIEARQVRGDYMGTPYTGIIYSATDDSGKVVSPPIKSARFGKRFGNTGLSERMLRHTQDFKEGRWAPAISGKVVWAMRNAKSEQEFRELLKQEHIDVVFRRNDTGRIYGVTFIDHERREAFNGSRMGKEFSANVFNGLVNWWEGIPWQDRQQSGPEELWKRYGHRMEENSALEQAAGIFSFEANPAVDYEEEAFRRRMKRKKKPQKRRSRGI